MNPKYIVKTTEWLLGMFDASPEPLISWTVCMDEAEADHYIQHTNRPGFGTQLTRVTCEKFLIGVIPRGTIEIESITMLEKAKEYKDFDGQLRIDVRLQGAHYDGPSVYWDSRGSSFVIVKPLPDQEKDKQLVTDQGVVLLSVNGMGEIRWAVRSSDANFDENKGAVEHFKLTWSK